MQVDKQNYRCIESVEGFVAVQAIGSSRVKLSFQSVITINNFMNSLILSEINWLSNISYFSYILIVLFVKINRYQKKIFGTVSNRSVRSLTQCKIYWRYWHTKSFAWKTPLWILCNHNIISQVPPSQSSNDSYVSCSSFQDTHLSFNV